jgi:hypothetical protein
MHFPQIHHHHNLVSLRELTILIQVKIQIVMVDEFLVVIPMVILKEAQAAEM